MSSGITKISTLFVGQSITMVLNFLILPYLARALTVHDNGTYGQTLLVISIFNGILQIGLPSVIYVFLGKEDVDENEVFKSNFLTLLFLGLIGAIVSISISPVFATIFSNPELTTLIRIYSCSLIFNLGYLSMNAFLIHKGMVQQSMITVVIYNIVKLGLLFIAIQFFNSLLLAFQFLALAEIFQFLLAFYFIPKGKLWTVPFNKVLAKEQIKLGIPLGLSVMLGLLMNQTDSVMVSTFLSTEDFAIFRNGAIAIPFVGVIFTSVSAITLPELGKYFARKDLSAVIKLKNQVITNSAALIYPLVLPILFFSPDLIKLYLSNKYAASAIVFLIYNLILFFRVNNYRDLLIASNNTNFILKITLISFFINIPLNYFFIQTYGYFGPAISTFLVRMILVITFTMKALDILEIRLPEFVELRKIGIIFLYSLLGTICFFLLHKSIASELAIPFYVFINAVTVYYLLLKGKILDHKIFSTIILKIPFAGAKINRMFLTSITSE